MTHKEAKRELRAYKRWLNQPENIIIKAIDYAINQLEQCEVYDEPVEMEIYDYEDGSLSFEGTRIVHGKFKSKFIASAKIDGVMYGWDEARPIEKEPLEFDEWLIKKRGININSQIPIKESLQISDKYHQYLKQFEQDNK